MRKRKVSRSDAFEGRAHAAADREEVLNYLREHTEIKEVILSGGDPLSLSDRRIDSILGALRTLPHLHSIRIHTRMPVTLPMRITDGLLSVFEKHYPLTVVTHFNHPAEITEDSMRAVRRMRMAGALILNQSVLLRGVNDSAPLMEELLLGLLRAGVKPYYLHQCDEVRGVSHFRTPPDLGKEILSSLRGRNPGIALPRFIIDLPGGGGKVPYEESYFEGSCEDGPDRYYLFRSSLGTRHRIRN